MRSAWIYGHLLGEGRRQPHPYQKANECLPVKDPPCAKQFMPGAKLLVHAYWLALACIEDSKVEVLSIEGQETEGLLLVVV